jgi:hypothetical protein
MLPPPLPPPCRALDAWALFAGMGLSVFTGWLLAFELVVVLPYRIRAFRRWRVRRINPPPRRTP